ncbi:MAG TPA: helix-turn-helix domain-containing protein [Pyrinomonadaceae bacterium]|nr:helix-turn-helix domain-containing protein [Pyrinomonadaceae bacterium]
MATTEMSLNGTKLPQPTAEDAYDDGYLRVEHLNYYAACGGQILRLPRTEFLILSRLVRTPERIVKSEELWGSAWGDKPLNTESLHVYIYRLRNKLAPHKLQIETMVNVGYRLSLKSATES